MADIKSIWVPGTLLRDNMLVGYDQDGGDEETVDREPSVDGLDGVDDVASELEFVGGGITDTNKDPADLFKADGESHVKTPVGEHSDDKVSEVGDIEDSDDETPETKKPESSAEEKKPEAAADAKKPEAGAEAKKPEEEAEAKKPEEDAEAKKPEEDAESKKTEEDAEAKEDSDSKKPDAEDAKSIKPIAIEQAAKSLDNPLPSKTQLGGLEEDEDYEYGDDVLPQEAGGWFSKNQQQFVPEVPIGPVAPVAPVVEHPVTAASPDLFNILQSMFVSSNDNTLADLMEESAYDIHKIKSYLSEISKSLELIATAAVKMSEKPKGNYQQGNNYQGNNNKMNSNN